MYGLGNTMAMQIQEYICFEGEKMIVSKKLTDGATAELHEVNIVVAAATAATATAAAAAAAAAAHVREDGAYDFSQLSLVTREALQD